MDGLTEKTAFGVRERLLLAFLGISMFSLAAAASGLYSLARVRGALEVITDQQVPEALSLLELSRKVESVVRAAPALLVVSSDKSREAVAGEIFLQIADLEPLLQDSRGYETISADSRFSAVEEHIFNLTKNLSGLDELVKKRLLVAARQEKRLRELTRAKNLVQRMLAPGERILGSQLAGWNRSETESTGDDSTQARLGLAASVIELVPQQRAALLADSIHGTLLRIADTGSAERIDVLIFPLQKSLQELSELTPTISILGRERLKKQIAAIEDLATGQNSIPRFRKQELELLEEARDLLEENVELSKALTENVNVLVAGAYEEIESANQQAKSIQAVNRKILIGVVAMSLVSSLLIVWLYVGRNLIARLTSLSNSMLAIAGGDLRAPLPDSGSNDEIGRMAEALVVFRDTAIEVEEKNLREIETARRRLVDAIENSSEGFVFFDREDRMVLCNTRFQQLLYSDTDVKIEPGTRFDTIIRAAAERGHIIDAEGRVDEWVADRMALHHDPGEPHIQRRHGGRWILITERRTGDGGTVAIYSDISDLKQRERELEGALEERKQALSLLAQELSEAAEYVKNILPSPVQDGEIAIDWRFSPSTSLGGDAFGYYWLDEDHFVVYLIDVSGHGVGAALLSVSVINSLRSQSLTATDFKDPAQVLSSLNEAFPGEENNHMFFTIWYGVYNKRTRQLNYASGGHPPALFIDDSKDGESGLEPLRTANAAIGVIPGIDFKKDTHLVGENGILYIFSDGVYEIEKSDGSMWQLTEFVDFMKIKGPAGQAKLDGLYDHVSMIAAHDHFEDDFTILAAAFR